MLRETNAKGFINQFSGYGSKSQRENDVYASVKIFDEVSKVEWRRRIRKHELLFMHDIGFWSRNGGEKWK